jgi:hypothetical protein
MPASNSSASGAGPTTASLAFAWLIALIVMVGLYLPPGSGIALETMANWHDQGVFLRAAVQTIERGIADERTRALVGPAYIGLTVAIGSVFGVTPDVALMLLSRLTFVACAGILSLVAIRDRAQAGPAMQFLLVAVGVLALVTSVWFRVFDVPWTHFVAAALLGAIVLVSLTRLPLAVRSVLVGALAIFLAQTRMFEALVALVAVALILPLVVFRHWQSIRTRPGAALKASLLQVALPAIGGGVLGFVAVGLMSHNWALYEQYGNEAGMVLVPQLAPIKAVQLFWDTCFATVCEFAPALTVPPFSDSLDSWRQPLLLQLPGLAAAAAGLLVLLALRPIRTLQLPLGVWFAVLAAGGTILAYVSGAPSGSPHLKYGFFRDFIAPMMLLVSAFVAALATGRATDGRWSARLIVPLVVCFAVLAGLTALRPVGLPQLTSAHASEFRISSSCEGGVCSFRLAALDGGGETLPYNDLAYVTCEYQPMDKPVQPVSELRVAAADCPHVSIVPVAAGVLYTPESEPFLRPGLDLTRATDSLALPPRP